MTIKKAKERLAKKIEIKFFLDEISFVDAMEYYHKEAMKLVDKARAKILKKQF